MKKTLKLSLMISSLLTLAPLSSHALSPQELSKCATAEAKALKTKSLVNMTDLEDKVLSDTSSLRTFIDDAAAAVKKMTTRSPKN